jgi:hypothetical protein
MLAPQGDKPGLLVTTTAFRSYDLSIEYQARSGSEAKVLVGCNAEGTPESAEGKVPLKPFPGEWVELRVNVVDGFVRDISYHHRGGAEGEGGGSPAPGTGKAGHIALSGKGFVVRSVKLEPTDMKSLFNGKDLTGWKVHPGRKSKFTVTDGTIHVKNGPGDLQSKGQWADFVLQVECISHGKHLNSGVFFRCLPDQYQQGYEAQVHNGFTEKPMKTYTLTEYDPKTHKETGKKRVKSTTMDYGTGAIYRRQPARFGVSKDGEWFTMTVAAQGRHIATWVNGVQVTDWTDNRPADKNPRKGYRAAKGGISFQGHDPTTDLSFRNIRIQDLAPGAAKKGRRGFGRPSSP